MRGRGHRALVRRTALLSGALCTLGCTGPAPEGEGRFAIVMAVGTLDPDTNIEVWLRNIESSVERTWRDDPFVVPRQNFVVSEPEFEPLLVRVDLSGPGSYVVRLVGRGGGAMLQYTGCYEVDGVVENDFVLLGRLEGNDADSDSFPDDAEAYCAMLRGEGTSCPTPEDLGACLPMFAIDCDPSDPGIRPLADETCGNGVDEDCFGGDLPCGAGCEPPCRADQQCLGGECGCPADECDGVCVDTSSDLANCGGCGVSCTGGDRTDSCEEGTCVCGSGAACGSASSCDGGDCRCDDGRGDCDDNRGNGCETDLQFDSDHCGDCETSCDTSCVDGDCL